MKRKDFLKMMPVAGMSPYVFSAKAYAMPLHEGRQEQNADTREYWVAAMRKLADPVLSCLAAGKLKSKMPVESRGRDREQYSHLEAFGRVLAGISPWLELGGGNTPEGTIRATYIDLLHKCLATATDPSSADYMNFTEGGQPLVDAAFMAHGLLRGYKQLWQPLPAPVKGNILRALKLTRSIRPGDSNWLLFSAMVEVFLLKCGGEWDPQPSTVALRKFSEWYKGDGVYGDGPVFHWDYYNSFVIHPMLLDIITVLQELGIESIMDYEQVAARSRRYAEVLERFISPEGTYPPVGRSLCYRFGVFQLLAQIALIKQLPEGVSPEQVRSALSAVISRELEAPETFDKNGWLNIGICGHQTGVSEEYISTGSLYLCTTAFLPLGLPEEDPFWISPAADWTSKKVWKGRDIPPDHAINI